MTRAAAEREGPEGDAREGASRRGTLELTVEVDGRGQSAAGDAVRAVLDQSYLVNVLTLDAMDNTASSRITRNAPSACNAFRSATRRSEGHQCAAACGGKGAAPAVARSTSERAMERATTAAPADDSARRSQRTCVTCHDNDGTVIDGVGIAPHRRMATTPRRATCSAAPMPRARKGKPCGGLPLTGLLQGRGGDDVPLRAHRDHSSHVQCASKRSVPHGEAARVELRTTHPERTRCRQCHVPESRVLT